MTAGAGRCNTASAVSLASAKHLGPAHVVGAARASPGRRFSVASAAAALLNAGRARDAAELAGDLMPEVMGTPDEPRLRHVLALATLELGGARAAAEQLEALAAHPDLNGHELSRVLAAAAMAHALAGAGHTAAALGERACRLAGEVGDRASLAVARSALALAAGRRAPRQAGKRPRPGLGWQSLSTAELGVARLVALGLTSREIGDRLFISRRTVETHIAHIFDKLGVSSRVQLAVLYERGAGHVHRVLPW
jgi:DNA-binding CsgD family transcriptional regulator